MHRPHIWSFSSIFTRFICFSDITHTLSKLSKRCILRICDDRLYFIVPEDHSIPYRISVWCVLHKNEFFNTYVMLGDGEKNEIFLEFSSGITMLYCFKWLLSIYENGIFLYRSHITYFPECSNHGKTT